MTGKPCDELSHAEELLGKGEYNLALEIVDSFSKSKKIELGDALYCSLLESRIRIKMGDLEKAKQVVDETLVIANQNNA